MTENGEPQENAIAERVNGIIKEGYLNNYETNNLPEEKNNYKRLSFYTTMTGHV
jgi:putative transposase